MSQVVLNNQTESQIRQFTLVNRPCESCGGDQFEALWTNMFVAKTRIYTWQFERQHVICRDCGFVFVAPVPDADELTAYYQDSYSYIANQAVDYNIQKRLVFIQRHLRPDFNDYLEIGANIETDFHGQLKNIFRTVLTLEPNQSVDTQHRSLCSITDQSMDMVASYFVLEHIPQVGRFLENCRRILRPGGVLIIEVPDLDIYTTDMSALIFHEHVNHFSLTALKRVAVGFGFEFIEGSRAFCSRDFGLAAAFTLRSDKPLPVNLPNEYERNRQTIEIGLGRVETYFGHFQKLRDQVTKAAGQGEKVLLWAANANTTYFTYGYKLPDGVKVVDSNPDKATFLADVPVYQPLEVNQHILESQLLVIFCGPVHKASILDLLKREFGKTFSEEQIVLVDFW